MGIITNNVSNYTVPQYNYDLYELNLNSENQNTLLSNVTKHIGTVFQRESNIYK